MTSGGYVGLSIATLLSQHHKVIAVDIVPEKVELINNKKSPIQDSYIEKYLAEKELNLTATLDAKEAYSDADFVVIADGEQETCIKVSLCVRENSKDEYRIGAEYRINRYLNNEDVNKISENVAGQLAEAVILHYEK